MRKYFEVAGANYNEAAFEELLERNDDFSDSVSDFLKEADGDDKLYELEHITTNVELVPEPDNKHDPNAIAIYADGKKIGYVRKSDQEAVNAILAGEIIQRRVEMYGGDCRIVVEDENGKKSLEFEAAAPYSAWLTIDVPDVAPVKEVKKAPASAYKIVGILLVVLSLLLCLAQPIIGVVGIVLGVVMFVLGKKNGNR